MKLSLKEAKVTRLWASNCATYSTGLDFKICLRAREVSGPFEKRASGVSQSTRLWFVGKQLRTKSCICTRREYQENRKRRMDCTWPMLCMKSVAYDNSPHKFPKDRFKSLRKI